jgi:hypothetical protein
VGQIPVGDKILTKTLGLNLSLFLKRMGFCFLAHYASRFTVSKGEGG